MPKGFYPDPSLQQQQPSQPTPKGFYPENSLSFGQSKSALGHSNSLFMGTSGLAPTSAFTVQGIQQLKQQAAGVLPTAGAIAGGAIGGLAGGAAGLETGPGAIATGYAGAVAGSGIGAAAGTAAQEKIEGQPLQPGQIAKQGGIYAGLEAVGGPVISALGKVTEAAGAGIAKMFIPKSEAEAGTLQAYKAGTGFLDRVKNVLTGSGNKPSTAASTAFEKGLVGTESMMGVQAKRAQGKIWNSVVKPALANSTDKVDMRNFFQTASDQISKDVNDPTREKMLQNALESVKEDFGNVDNISMEQLQKYKEGWAEFVPEKSYKGQPIAGALNEVRSVLADSARQQIYNSLGDDVKQAYLDYGNLTGITKLGQKAMAGSGFKGGAGQLAHSLWEMATVPAGTIGGQTLYKVGQVGEFVGKPGARTLRDLLGIPESKGNTSESSPSQ